MEYNRLFGTGDPFKSIMSHAHRMAKDITLMREFGPNPALGADYRQQLWMEKARGDEAMTKAAEADTNRGLRMFKVLSGSPMADSAMQDWIATFMSSARHVMTSAFLDRAVIASMSDMNTMRLAAQSMGMNPGNLIGKQIGALQSLSREELLRAMGRRHDERRRDGPCEVSAGGGAGRCCRAPVERIHACAGPLAVD